MSKHLKIGACFRSPLEESLICPLTQRLPLDPVTAEDGIVYERRAIELYFRAAALVPSPLNQDLWIGTRLLPAPRHYQIVQASIENDDISKAYALEWKRRVVQKERMERLLEKAGSGNPGAMLAVAKNYFVGREGFEKDPVVAYNWYRTANKLHGRRPMRLVEIASLSSSSSPPPPPTRNKPKAVKKEQATKVEAEVGKFQSVPTSFSSSEISSLGQVGISWEVE